MWNYKHYNTARNRRQGQPFTVALNLDFHKDMLFSSLKRNMPVAIEIGMAKLHKDDRFVKQIGRTIARIDTQLAAFKITGVQVESNKQAFYLINEEKNLFIILHVDVNKDKPIMTYASYNKIGKVKRG